MSVEDVGHPRVGGLPCVCPECVKKRMENQTSAAASNGQHSPLPWEIHRTGSHIGIKDAGGRFVIRKVVSSLTIPEYEQLDADLERAIKSVNRDPAFQKLVEAAQAAIRYDECIQSHAWKGESYVQDESLDDLYAAWINTAREALHLAREPTK